MDVSIKLVCRSLEKISCRNDRIRVLDIRLSLLRKSVFRKTRIVPVRDRLHDICRIVCREHHRRSHIHIGKEITYRDSTISICSRTCGDSGRTSYLERELSALCHVKVQVCSVVDSLEVECGILPCTLTLNKRSFIGITYRNIVLDLVSTSAKAVVGIDGMCHILEHKVIPVVVRITDRAFPVSLHNIIRHHFSE